jgi:ATP-dependent DNA helicase RecG
MTAERIRQLIDGGEGLNVEFKECVNELGGSVWETVCSFSNRYGGHLILGVKNDGGIIGVNPRAAEQMKKNFANALNNPEKMSPSLFLCLDEFTIDDKLLLYAYVPVSSQLQSCSGRIYDRNEDGDYDVTNSAARVGQLALRKSSQFTEREVFPYATLDDIRLDLIPRVQRMAAGHIGNHPWKDMEAMDIFKSAGLYEDDIRTGVKGFNLAGILLFGKDNVLQSVAPGCVTDALLRRVNIDRYDDRRYVETNLIEAYDCLMGFIEKHTNDPFVLDRDKRVSARYWIARELVSNLLMHREYSKAIHARLIIERERIYADNWNRSNEFGRIDPKNFTPQPKNPIIARFFMNIGLADQLGSGVRNLYKYTMLYSGEEPELIEGDMFKTIIPLFPKTKEHADKLRLLQGDVSSVLENGLVLYTEGADKKNRQIKQADNADADTLCDDLRTAQESGHVSGHEGGHVSGHDERILLLLEYCTIPRSRDEMQRFYGISSRDYFHTHVLKPLLESGQLKMTIPDKPKSRNQKYIT